MPETSSVWIRQHFTHENKGFNKFLEKCAMLYTAPLLLGRSGMLTQWMSEKIKTLKVRSILGKVREKEIGWLLALISVCSQTDEIKHFGDIKFGSKFPWGLSKTLKTLPQTNT